MRRFKQEISRGRCIEILTNEKSDACIRVDESIKTLYELERIVGAKRICWRYDPILA